MFCFWRVWRFCFFPAEKKQKKQKKVRLGPRATWGPGPVRATINLFLNFNPDTSQLILCIYWVRVMKDTNYSCSLATHSFTAAGCPPAPSQHPPGHTYIQHCTSYLPPAQQPRGMLCHAYCSATHSFIRQPLACTCTWLAYYYWTEWLAPEQPGRAATA